MIKLDYKSGKPLHEQITGGIKELVISGILKPDSQLPSVRELSVSLTVNPNTVQRAYKTLEIEGIIYSIRGKGNFVAKVPETSGDQLEKMYEALAENVREIAFRGGSREKIINIIDETYKKGEGNCD